MPRSIEDALLRSAVNAAANGLVLVDALGTIVFANRQAEVIFGYGPGELLEQPLAILVPEPLRAAHHGHHISYVAHPEPRIMGKGRELWGRRRDGREVPVEIGLSYISHPSGPHILASIIDLTERRRAEAQIRWLSMAVEQGPTSVVMTDIAGNIEYVNAKFTEVTGYTLDEVRGKNPRILKSGETPEPVYRDLWTAIGAGRSWYGELLNRKKNGDTYWDAMWVYPIRDASGAVTRFLAIKEDITDRRRAQESLRASEAHLRTILENIGDAVFIADASGRYTDANPRACELTGYALDELLRLHVWDTYVDDERGEARRRLIDVGAGHQNVFERNLRRKDGSVVIVEVNASRLPNGHLLATARDITQRRNAEAALRASEQRARALFETVNMIVLGLNEEGRVNYVNPYYLQLTGFTAAEILGHEWFRFLPDRSRPQLQGVFRELLEHAFHPHYENPILTKAGTERMIAWNNTVVRDPLGMAIGTLSIGEDITERNQLEQQLRQAQKMEAVGRLAGGVAHDFNNVLTAVFGYVDLLKEELEPNSDAQQDLQEVRKAAERAASLTRQLLAFSRQQVLEPVVLNPNELIDDFEKMLQRVIGEDVELHLALGTDVGNVRADPGQLQQVIMNLVVNARDAMPTGGKLLIETSNADLSEQYAELHQAVIPGPYVMLAVSDTGTGITPEVKARIFEPFFTTKEKGKGTGLGLSTVYGIVKQSGGYVWVYSEVGRGTTFKIYLPRVDAPAERVLKPRDVGSLAGSETILLAEDDAILRPLARSLLEKLGYKVLEGDDAESALAAVRAHSGPIHLLIADVVMPGPSGRELARRLVELSPTTKVLYISGYTDDAIVHHGMLEPGLDFLQKPFTPAVLARKVREVLDKP